MLQKPVVDSQGDGPDHSSANTGDTVPGLSGRKSKKSYHKKSRTGCATCRSRRVKVGYVRLFLRRILVYAKTTNSVMKPIPYVETAKDTE